MATSTPVKSSAAASLCIVIAAKGDAHPGACLWALGAEPALGVGRLELHVVHDRAWDWSTLLAELPNLSLEPCRPAQQRLRLRTTRVPEQTSILNYWGSALAQADSDYVAVLDAACPPAPGWLRRTLQAIDLGCPLFFGAVDCDFSARDPRIIGYLIEYAQFRSPPGAGTEYPGNNIVLLRELLEPGAALLEHGFQKTFLMWKLKRKQGLEPSAIDDMPVLYDKSFSLWSYARRRLNHGRCFAAGRGTQPAQPARMLCVLFTPLLGPLRCWRIAKGIRHDLRLRRAFWHFFPSILFAEMSWSLGEFLGYCCGAGDSCARLD